MWLNFDFHHHIAHKESERHPRKNYCQTNVLHTHTHTQGEKAINHTIIDRSDQIRCTWYVCLFFPLYLVRIEERDWLIERNERMSRRSSFYDGDDDLTKISSFAHTHEQSEAKISRKTNSHNWRWTIFEIFSKKIFAPKNKQIWNNRPKWSE